MVLERASRGDVWTPRLVWGAWAALTVAAIGLILALGADVPYWDEWGDVLPFYAGFRPLDAEALWEAHNEHRIPLARLILVGLGNATNHDFRAGAVFSALALSAASALLLRSAREVDGRLRLYDCALPLLLLHWGHYMTLLWSYQVHGALLALLSCALLGILSHHAGAPSLRTTVAYGACLVLLPLCQAGGSALATVLALWIAALGGSGVRSPEASTRHHAWVAIAFGAAAVALAAVSYVAPKHPTAVDPLHVAWWSAVVLSTGFGLTERTSPLLTVLMPAATAALALATGVLLLRVARAQSRERLRAAGLGLFLLAFLGLALGIAWGRQEWSLSNRYPVLAAPLLCAIHLTWRRYGPGRSGSWVCATLCAALVLFAPWNTAAGLRFARQHAETAAAFERDVRAGMPFSQLATKYLNVLHPSRSALRRGLWQMREARIGAFRPSQGESR